MHWSSKLRILAVVTLSVAWIASARAGDGPGADNPDHKGRTKAAETTGTEAASGDPVATVVEPNFDFREVWVNEVIDHTFVIKNTGNAPLKIERVKPACGCTLAGKHPSEIAPGESGEFPFRLNTNKLNGRFAKAITITTNDPKNQQLRLSLTGVVKHYIDVSPAMAQFGRVMGDSVLTRELMLTNNTEKPLELSLKKTQEGCFNAELTEIEPGRQYKLVVTAEPPFQTGINRFSLDLTTNVDKQKDLSIICMATMPQRLELRPDKIRLSPQAQTDSIRKIWFTNNTSNPVVVKDAKATDDKLKVETQEIQAGQKYQFTVTIPANYTPPSPNTAIVLATDDAKEPILRVPVETIQSRTPRRRERPAMKLLGEKAPAQQVTAHGDKQIQLGGESDKVQVVMFYASWCGFCKRALPKVQELSERLAQEQKDAEIILVNLDDRTGRRGRTEEQTLDHYKQTGLTMPLVLDPEKAIGQPYKVTSFPTTFVVSKQGVVEAVHVGAGSDFDQTLEREVNLLLEGKTRKDFPSATTASIPQPQPPAAGTVARNRVVQGKLAPSKLAEERRSEQDGGATKEPSGDAGNKPGK